MKRYKFIWMGPAVFLLAFGALLGSCAVLGVAPYEITGPRLFGFPGDWEKIPAKTVTLFYPGQTSWEFLTSPAHPGAPAIDSGCATCHTGQEKALGAKLVQAGPRENDPIAGKIPSIDLTVRAAYDAEFAYFQFRWPTQAPHAMHTLWRYDGKQWVPWGGEKPEATKKGILPSYEDRLAIILDEPNNVPAYDGAGATFSQVGCWMTCHNSMRAMPNDVPRKAIDPHPYWGAKGRRVGDIRKYLLITRTAQDDAGAWDKVKPAADLAKLKSAGKFLELWQWRAARSNAIGYASDDWVMEYRNGDAGRSPFFNPPKPQFMYDEKLAGFRAIPESQLQTRMGQQALVEKKNAVAIDPNAKFAVGDLLPQYLLREPDGSAADVQAFGRYADGHWVVELRRKLNTGQADDKVLKPGTVYPIGFGIFDDTVSNRRHYVTLPMTLGLGAKGDVMAVKVGP
ncbi:MAG: ethylbenzene dehydrogenase-related protein [Candidatus Binatia bacterium]